VVSILVYLLGSTGRAGATPVRLTLAGAAVAALLASVTSAIVIMDSDTLDQFRFWVVGSLAGRRLEVATQVAPFIAAGLALALILAPSLNAIALGEEAAGALGARVRRARAGSALAVVLLCGAATAACGPVGFVGLVVPHLARRVCGPDHRWLLPYSALIGASVLLLCDVIGRVAARPGEVQAGITTSLVGGIAFVLLVRRGRLTQL
jgi:iron complex transport system permease protein